MQPHSNPELIIGSALADADENSVLWLASDLARRLQWHCHLVHALDRAGYRNWLNHLLGSDAERRLAVEEEAQRLSAQRLAAIATRLHSRGPATWAVAAGRPADALAAAAVSRGAAMVAIGWQDRPGILQGSMSTASALLTHSPVPTLVLGQDRLVDFSRVNLRIVLADDLQDQTIRAMHWGLQFAALFDQTEIRHVHFHSPMKTLASQALELLQTAAARVTGRQVTPLELHIAETSRIRTLLEVRARDYRRLLETRHCRYQAEIIEGSPADNLKTYLDRQPADLLIMGQHRNWHGESLTGGQLPMHQLALLPCALVAVPTESPMPPVS